MKKVAIECSKFHILAALYAGILIISNILANKIIMPFGIVLPCAVILFPVISFSVILLFVIVIFSTLLLLPSSFLNKFLIIYYHTYF